MKVIVFDLGGTLMQYAGMPYSWVDFYHHGFESIIQEYNCNIPKEAVEKSLRMLKDFNPRVQYREIEYSPEFIFTKVLEHWHMDIPIQNCIESFWGGLTLKAEIFSDTFEVLSELKKQGYVIAVLTDLPSAMPDKVFRKDITELLGYIDCYVSSSIAGYRKPHCKGLQIISEKYAVPIEKLLFVGDEEKDRKTAENANCQFIKIERETKNQDSIHNLYKLLELLQ